MTLLSVDDLAERNARVAAFFWILAAALAFLLCFTQLGVMVSSLAGRVLFPLVFPAAVLAALIVSYRLQRRAGFTRTDQWRAAGLFLLLLGVSWCCPRSFSIFPGTENGTTRRESSISGGIGTRSPIRCVTLSITLCRRSGIMPRVHGTLPPRCGRRPATSMGESDQLAGFGRVLFRAVRRRSQWRAKAP